MSGNVIYEPGRYVEDGNMGGLFREQIDAIRHRSVAYGDNQAKLSLFLK